MFICRPPVHATVLLYHTLFSLARKLATADSVLDQTADAAGISPPLSCGATLTVSCSPGSSTRSNGLGDHSIVAACRCSSRRRSKCCKSSCRCCGFGSGLRHAGQDRAAQAGLQPLHHVSRHNYDTFCPAVVKMRRVLLQRLKLMPTM